MRFFYGQQGTKETAVRKYAQLTINWCVRLGSASVLLCLCCCSASVAAAAHTLVSCHLCMIEALPPLPLSNRSLHFFLFCFFFACFASPYYLSLMHSFVVCVFFMFLLFFFMPFSALLIFSLIYYESLQELQFDIDNDNACAVSCLCFCSCCSGCYFQHFVFGIIRLGMILILWGFFWGGSWIWWYMNLWYLQMQSSEMSPGRVLLSVVFMIFYRDYFLYYR